MKNTTKFAKNAITASLVVGTSLASASVLAKSPNIVAIMVDDVAPMDLSAYHRGLGAIKTPHIDSIAQRGVMISDYYAQSSSTAGRSAFITGQYPIRTGLTGVGQPAQSWGLKKRVRPLPSYLSKKATRRFTWVNPILVTTTVTSLPYTASTNTTVFSITSM